MAEIQVLAVLSLDGCISSKQGATTGFFWLSPATYGIDNLRKRATFRLSPQELPSLLQQPIGYDDSLYLIEATEETSACILELLREAVVDELIIYTVPYIAGSGKRLFAARFPFSHWELVSQTTYTDGTLCAVYRKQPAEKR